jgi:hypothetical protein
VSAVPRPAFDGCLIEDRRWSLTWLVIDGFRYEIDPEAVGNIFEHGRTTRPLDDASEAIPIKGAIRSGSRLVRGDPHGDIHLFAVDGTNHRLHTVETWDSFVQYGFARDKVLLVPEAMLRLAPEGPPISAVLDRIRRRGHSMYLPLLEVLS